MTQVHVHQSPNHLLVLFHQRPHPYHHREKRGRTGDIDELLVKSLNSLQEKKLKVDDDEGLFGKQVAATLRRFEPRQKALAKLKIPQCLTEIEFPSGFMPTSVEPQCLTQPMTYSSCNNKPISYNNYSYNNEAFLQSLLLD